MGRVVVVELCACLSHLWQDWRHTQTCATSGVVVSPHGMLWPSEAENVPELIPWVGLWVLQAETGGGRVGVVVCVDDGGQVSMAEIEMRPYGLCHGVQPVSGDHHGFLPRGPE